MTSFVMPSYTCQICGKPRRIGDHSQCSKKLQQKTDTKRKNSGGKYDKYIPVDYWEKQRD